MIGAEMAHLSRAQLLVYGAIAVVVLLLGARWVSASEGDSGASGPPAFASGSGESIGAADPDGGAGSSGEAGAEASTGAPLVEAGDREALVHVTGAVRKPGVYRLPLGARVADAVERAGGPAPRAATSSINLAARLSDGQQVVVPLRGRGSAPGGSSSSPQAGRQTPEGGPISLGSASPQELESIEGIGPVTAAAIIAFRDERGGLSSVDELDEVSGIGPATLEALRSRLQP